ncbi:MULTISPECIES: peptide cleavage/export ABC transporter [Lacticaseibacillus]|uniref:Peptide ABC transporter ATP-binding protein n=2 Tax=Lacticaseibacillus TaxID=2759736 RepID=A0AAN1F0R2_LACCA|nr:MULTISPECIES: peptide cleavage/export ABC transporter [Lacticaseibacillus]ARY92613.1 peptide ABC transporter ATP-binding protein [Lacticaseibacillus casei]KAB1969546.1 peptide cleavage/export ABC transporter [Lacticaseibacillus casei]WLV80513.1 peptide cleavage/export ABC transporter [Lacticaseibacillus sp. NCIMB 15473]WNX24474.1 peptide cleavage/export ABC transporter [Lacticaseibacillus casei]WNX27246.1 peptide cleavage/export ABC transporter [Lacticaseibacillus casei]
MTFFANFKTYYTSQIDERDCGVAALNTVLKRHGSDFSLAHLRNLAKTDNSGTTALGIVKAAQDLGFETKAIRADMSLFDANDVPYPFIAHVIKNGKLLHYYVVFKATKTHLIIGDPDPSVKLIKMPKERFAKEWSGVAIFLAPTSAYTPQKDTKGSLFAFVPLLVKQKRLISEVVLAAVLITIISIAGSYFFQAIIDTYLPNAMRDTLSIIASGLIIAYLFQAIFTYAQSFLMIVLGQRLTIDVTLGYVRHLFELPMSFFATRRVGEITSRFSDASKIIDALGSTIMTMFLDIWIVIAVGIFLAIQNTTLFLVSLVALPIYFAVVWSFKTPFNRLNQDAMESNAIVSSSIIESLNGIETIKAMTGETTSYGKVDHEFVDLLKKTFSYQKTDQLQQAIKLAVKMILNIVILWIGALLVMQNQMTLGQLFTYNALLTYFTNPLESIINLQPKLQMARVANNRLNEVYLVESEFAKSRPITQPQALQGDLQFDHVNFTYGYGPNVLTDLSLTIPLHTKLTIVGMSGSGKTTLAKLLVGFFDVASDQGKVLINQHDLSEVNRTTLRQFINYVPQDPFIFSGTILDNLTLGSRPNLTQAEIEQACAAAEIKTDIEKMPLGYTTELSESGAALSGGQKQRLAIARALLSPAQVFIFDESTSSLDTITERNIVDHLMQLTDKTIIFVAHRLAIAARTDNVVVLDHGKLVEQGNHQELLAKGGYYARLVNE